MSFALCSASAATLDMVDRATAQMASYGISLVVSYNGKNDAGQQEIYDDTENCLFWSMKFGDPSSTGQVAYYQAKKEIDTSVNDTETSKLMNVIETVKSETETLQTSTQQNLTLYEPGQQVWSTCSHILQSWQG